MRVIRGRGCLEGRVSSGQILWVLALLLSLILIAPVMVQMVGTSRKELFKTEEFGLMADEVAQGALSHGLAWFKSHPIQPVGSYMDPIEYPYPDAVFFPREDPDSPTCCTKNEGVGLVGEYQISAQRNLWARYEMRRQGDPALGYDRLAAHDITNLRYPGHSLGEGLGWDVRARGMVYKRLDPAREPDQTPNKVMGRSAFQVELRRMTLDLPEESALIVNSFADVTLPAAGVTIDGNGAYGITARAGAPPAVSFPVDVSGAPAFFTTASNWSIESIFGVTIQDLRRMADLRIAPSTVGVYPPSSVSVDGQIVHVVQDPAVATNGTFELGWSMSRGLILVESPANVVIWGESQYPSSFDGLIVWNSPGTLTIEAVNNIRGAVIATAGGRVVFGAPNYIGGVSLVYSSDVLEYLRKVVLTYRIYGTPMRVTGGSS